MSLIITGLSTVDLESLVGKSNEEILETLRTAMEGMDAEERTTFLEQLPEELGDITDSLYAKIDGLEEDINALEDDEYMKEKYEEDISELEELVDLADEFESLATEVNTDITGTEEFYTREVTGSTTVDYSGQVKEGDVITCNIADIATTAMFEDEDSTGLTQYASTITINCGEDQVSLLSYTQSPESATFSVTTKEGITFHIVANGLGNIVFNGQGYTTADALKSWPEDLLKRSYDGTKNMFNNVYGFESEEVVATTEIGEEFVEGFDADMTALNELLNSSYPISLSSGDPRDSLSPEDQALIKETMLSILGSDLYITDSDISIAEVWEELLSQIHSKDPLIKNAIMCSLVYLVGKYASDKYNDIFTTNITSTLTESLNYLDNLPNDSNDGENAMSADAFTKMALIINNQYTTAPAYASVDALLANYTNYEENVVVLDFIKQQLPNIAVDSELAQQEASTVSNPLYGTTTDFVSAMNTYITDASEKYAEKAADHHGDSIKQNLDGDYDAAQESIGEFSEDIERQSASKALTELMTQISELISEDGQIRLGNLRDLVTSYLGALDPTIKDDATSLFMCMLFSVDYNLARTLCNDSTFASGLIANIDAGGGVASTLVEEAKALINCTKLEPSEPSYDYTPGDGLPSVTLTYRTFPWLTDDETADLWATHNASLG